MKDANKAAQNFNEVVELLYKGEDVCEEELVDAWSYATDGVNEMFRLAKCLREGYRRQQATIKRKDALLEAKIREIDNAKRTIWVLNQKIRQLTGRGEEGTPCTSNVETADTSPTPR